MFSARTLAVALLVCLFTLLINAQETTVKATPAPKTSAASGKEMYEAYCASCHGKDGKGGGPAAVALKASTGDLTTLAKSHGGKFPAEMVQQTIRGDIDTPAHGSKDMPVWGPVLSSVSGQDAQQVTLRVHNLTGYIESLQGK